MGLPHLASIVIQEKYPVQMLEPLVQRLHCVPRFLPGSIRLPAALAV